MFKERRRRKKRMRKREREREAERTKAFVLCFELFPEDRLTHAVFHPFGKGGERWGRGRKEITSIEGEWHKVENLAGCTLPSLQYRIKPETALPLLHCFCEQNLKLLISFPALFLALQLRKSPTFSGTSTALPSTCLHNRTVWTKILCSVETKHLSAYVRGTTDDWKHEEYRHNCRGTKPGEMRDEAWIYASLLF